MTRPIAALVVSLVILSASVPASGLATQAADDIVEKHLAALGGREALGKLTSRRSSGTITINTPNGDLSGPVELMSKAPNKVRAQMTIDLSPVGLNEKMIIEQKFDGAAAWSLNTLQGDTQITGGQLEMFKNNTFPSPLLNYKAAGTKIDLLPKDQLPGSNFVGLLLTPKSGPSIRIFLDATTNLVARTLTIVFSPQAGGDIEQTSEVSDYRVVDGVKIPFVIVNSSALQKVTIKLDKVEHNVALDDALFRVK